MDHLLKNLPNSSRRNNILVISAILLSLGTSTVLPSRPELPLQPALVTKSTLVPPPRLEAKATLAVDFSTGDALFEKNADVPLPLASITKIVSALVVLDNVGPDEDVAISSGTLQANEFSFLKIGEHFKARDLLAMVMVESSNDAITALVDYVVRKNGVDSHYASAWFLNRMQQKAVSLGAPKMVFYNPTGLDVSQSVAGAYGSARDVIAIAGGSLGSLLWGLGYAKETVSREGIRYLLHPTNILAPNIVQLRGAKTGFTDLAGGNLLVITEEPVGHPIGIVVLGSSQEGRFLDMHNLLDWIRQSALP